jgi:hypothetical protein
MFDATSFAGVQELFCPNPSTNVVPGIENRITSPTAIQAAISTDGASYAQNASYTFSPLSAGTWHWYLVVRKGTTITYYMDGVKIGQLTGVGTLFADSANPAQIGYYSSSNPFWVTSYLDEIGVWNATAAGYPCPDITDFIGYSSGYPSRRMIVG